MNKFNIYVINLKKDKDRLLTIKKKLYPNSIIRINGIYGKDQNYSNNKSILFFLILENCFSLFFLLILI